MVITNKHGLPEPIYQALLNDSYDDGGADITVTRLIDSPRINALLKAHGGERDASESLWALLGQAMHHILERGNHKNENEIREKRLFAMVQGWRVSGQFDRLVLADGILQDYKVTSAYSLNYGIKDEWVKQLNVLRWLAELNGIEVKKLEIVAILRDWNKQHAKKYPLPVQVLDVPMMGDDEIEDYVKERVLAHQAAEENLPECTGEETWQGRRCKDYCPVRAVCQQEKEGVA
jgi:hypothetical protein